MASNQVPAELMGCRDSDIDFDEEPVMQDAAFLGRPVEKKDAMCGGTPLAHVAPGIQLPVRSSAEYFAWERSRKTDSSENMKVIYDI